jgi:hypothetical protein
MYKNCWEIRLGIYLSHLDMLSYLPDPLNRNGWLRLCLDGAHATALPLEWTNVSAFMRWFCYLYYSLPLGEYTILAQYHVLVSYKFD